MEPLQPADRTPGTNAQAGRAPAAGVTTGRTAEPGAGAIRASDRERDAAVARLQTAFAEGRLDDLEFDVRMRAALSAVTRPELDGLFADLPPEPAAGGGHPVPLTTPGRFQVAYKHGVRRAGRWRVPARYTSVIYKGSCVLDLRAAELEGPVTTIRALAYKSRIEVIVPPGVRVEISGFGVSSEVYGDQGPHAPVLVVRGLAYKGSIDAVTGGRGGTGS